MNRTLTIATLVAFASLWPDRGGAEEIELSTGVGISKTLKVSNIRRIAIGNPRVADVKVVDGEVIVNGMGVGRTSLLIWKRNGQKLSYLVVVLKDETVQALEEIKRLLVEVEGVTIRMVGDHILLEGTVNSFEDAARVEKVGGLYPNLVRVVVTLDAVPLDKVVR